MLIQSSLSLFRIKKAFEIELEQCLGFFFRTSAAFYTDSKLLVLNYKVFY